MASLQQRVEAALRRLAAQPGPDEVLAIERVQSVGEPRLWEERIAFERGQAQHYSRIRSLVDEGGVPIGAWTTSAEEWRVPVLARTLLEVGIWTHASDSELLPGMEVVNWTCITSHGVLDLIAAGSSPVAHAMAPLDLELRRLANVVAASPYGAGLRVALQARPAQNRQYECRIGIVNDGDRPCLVVNPLGGGLTGQDYLRVESALVPEEEPGVTGPGPLFEPLPVDLAALLAQVPEPTPWLDEYLLLMPGTPLIVPVRAHLVLPPGSHLLRAVFSTYGYLDRVAGLPVIRGRAFSNEVEVEV
jgi:hypothetical protein